jgi:hypothetical protein
MVGLAGLTTLHCIRSISAVFLCSSSPTGICISARGCRACPPKQRSAKEGAERRLPRVNRKKKPTTPTGLRPCGRDLRTWTQHLRRWNHGIPETRGSCANPGLKYVTPLEFEYPLSLKRKWQSNPVSPLRYERGSHPAPWISRVSQ